ncbi:fungal transcriptional regulatory-like protein [Dichotomopilus funicola]|uniref:Fungal transcriptional regulatory-like protein n=1 Tax=Dichotomopilus funicola TaxID=1934379 RepID=A0AAN6V6U3_9PEZI|nr:fungal transcriptional regulatory-like protein [Dichotomopilus funicola]
MEPAEPQPTTNPSPPGEADRPTGSGAGDNKDQPPDASKKAAAKRRTKTGCLTCRKRRIKCDEGKPICNNCIKSKRDCEGYSQRLTFKKPLGSFPSGHLYRNPVYNHRQSQDAFADAQVSTAQNAAGSSQVLLPVIAPKPSPAEYLGTVPPTTSQQQGPGKPSFSGSSDFDPAAQHLPSPPFLGYDINSSQSHGQPPTSGEIYADDGTIEDAANTLYNPQQHAFLPSNDGFQPRHQPLAAEEGYWQSDDEASMADSDDDTPLDSHRFHLDSNDLGIQVARRLEPQRDLYGIRIRSFGGLVDDNILDTYTPSSASSPLNDTQTATIFWYFVNVTGHSMSMYERHPFDPTPMFRGHPVPKQRQHIWTYTFPIMAFNHPALMQAMLALGSLQMAKLNGTPPTAAMKHYHLCLRRVAKNYQSPYKRTQPATLAATLLLGFYEVWNSDHDKWCKHMWGGRAIIKDIPLRRMTKDVLAFKRQQRERILGEHQCNEVCFASHGDLSVDHAAVDYELIYQLTGQSVDYELPNGYVFGDQHQPSRITERDVETYEQLRDLYWWYCKMDVYQSFLGGTRPLMDYKHWTQCVPRGPFGRIDSIHGTFDFSLLLLGRLASFAARDLTRKRKARKAQGPPLGQGRGGPGGGPGSAPPPSQGPGQAGPAPGAGRGQSPPTFPGLIPTSGRVAIPRGFTPPRESSPTSDSTEGVDLDTSTTQALQEWEEIRKAFEIFRARLGPDFEPMAPDVAPPEMTPFGPALMYRTYSIAGIWLNYYMGLIVLHRSHPSMPPVAVIAAGMAAPQTGRWANEIARICAGLHEDTTHVSAISTLFQDIHQRHWAIRRLRDITRLTGWQSARQIADGCESGWNKAAEVGRGPPYHSPPELGPIFHDGESVWNRPRRIDRRIQELEASESRLVLARSEQAHYAMGLLSVENDLDALVIDEADGDRGGRDDQEVADTDQFGRYEGDLGEE